MKSDVRFFVLFTLFTSDDVFSPGEAGTGVDNLLWTEDNLFTTVLSFN